MNNHKIINKNESLEKLLNEKYDFTDKYNYSQSELEKLLNEIDDLDNNEIFSQQEMMLSKLEYNKNIIKENNEDIQKIYQDVLDINRIFKDLNKLVNEQTEPIEQLEIQLNTTLKKTKDGVKQLEIADKMHSSWLSKKNKIILLSIAGLSINVPIAVFLGLKAGAISGLSTIGLSAISTLFSKK